jgi:hypothetical protein
MPHNTNNANDLGTMGIVITGTIGIIIWVYGYYDPGTIATGLLGLQLLGLYNYRDIGIGI